MSMRILATEAEHDAATASWSFLSDNRFIIVADTHLDVTAYDDKTIVAEYELSDVCNISYAKTVTNFGKFRIAREYDSIVDAHAYFVERVTELLANFS